MEWEERPPIFTLIDGNNFKATKDLLISSPREASRELPGESDTWFPLHMASQHGRIRIMRLLLAEPYNVDPNIRSRRAKFTPLHQAVRSRQPDAVELLLAAGAQVDSKYFVPGAKDMTDLTALEIAVENCVTDGAVGRADKRIIATLLRHGADYLRNVSGRGEGRTSSSATYTPRALD